MRRLFLLLAMLALVASPEVFGGPGHSHQSGATRRQTPVDPCPRSAPGLLGPQPPHRRLPL